VPVAENALYRDFQNLTDADREFAQVMIKKMLEKNQMKE
jgi:hypothetical protein